MAGNSIARGLTFIPLLAAVAIATPPDVSSLFPGGAQQGTSVSVSIQGKLGTGTCHVWYSRPGVNVAFPEKPGPLTVSVESQAEPGVCWIRFYNDEGPSELRPFVVGTCREINEVEPNDDAATAQALSEFPLVVNGQHGKNGDSDSFSVRLSQDQVLVASLMANRVLGSPQDAVLQILGPDGFVLEQNEDDQGLDPFLSFRAPADGLYRLRTWAFPANPDSSIRLFGNPACVYRLTVTTGPFVDHVIPAAIQAGTSQRVHLEGWNLTDQPFELEVPVSAIQRRYEWPLPDWQHRLPFAILVEPHSATVELEPNDLAQPQTVTWPVSVTGRIDQPRDVDAFEFVGKKGQRLRFEIMAREMGSPLDPVLRLYDSSGKLLKEADDDGRQSADPDIEFTLPDDGTYRATVTDRFLHDGQRYIYVLAITEPQPDFVLSVSKDSLVSNSGSDVDIPINVTRMSGFSDVIDLGIDGLPAGVTSERCVSEAMGDSSKSVTLKLKSDGTASFSGPVRIWGRARTTTGLDRSATFAMKAFGTAVTDLWLTVIQGGQ